MHGYRKTLKAEGAFCKGLLVSVHNVRYPRCCQNFKSSNTLVYRGLKFLRALISNILNKHYEFIDKHLLGSSEKADPYFSGGFPAGSVKQNSLPLPALLLT